MDSLLGIRWINTLKKLPRLAPKAAIIIIITAVRIPPKTQLGSAKD
jgi:hypothetical protein